MQVTSKEVPTTRHLGGRGLAAVSRRVRSNRRSVLLAALSSLWWLRSDVASSAFVGASAPRPSHLRQAELLRPPSRVVLSAGGENLFDRFVRVTKSNMNKALQSFEDPEKVLDQAVNDMQGDLVKVRQSYAQVVATQRKLQNQIGDAEKQAEEWYKRASLAVDKGDDELAKEALSRRQTFVQKADSLKMQADGMQVNVDKLMDSVQQLEAKIQQAKEEKENLIARARTAKTTTQVNEMLSGVDGSSSAAAFDRMKDKVDSLETRAEVSQGLLSSGSAPSSLEERFKALESGSAVDDELAKMKGKKALPSGGPAAADGKAGESPPPAESAIDKELAEMRKKLKESDV